VAATNLEIWQTGTIVSIEELSPTIRYIEISQSNPAKADVGSHIDLMIDINGVAVRRSYSVVTQSADQATVSIAVLKTRNSRGGSEAMHQLKVGDQLDITQPIQNFPLRFGAQHYLLVAGGIGITALLGMARALKTARASYELVYVARTRKQAVFAAELASEHGDRFRLHIDDEDSPLSIGNLVAQQNDATELYMCGPIRLMDEVRRSWVSQEFDITNLRYETFGASGWFEPQAFTVKIQDQNLSLEVGRNATLLDALESAGVEVMADCRKGECGLCELKVQSVQGEIDHRDVFYSEAQKVEGHKIATCVSRVFSSQAAPEITLSID